MTSVEIPEWLERDFSVLRREGVEAVVRRDFREWFDRLGLLHAADRPPDELAPGARRGEAEGGRGPVAFLPAGPEGEVVVRPYRRGGLVRHFLERRYLLGQRSVNELQVTESLRRRDVPVPRVLAALHSRADPGYRAALVTRRVAGARPAPGLLRDGTREECADALRRVGESVGRLHAAGGIHPDLNAHNFLLPGARRKPAVILDFDRARIFKGRAPGFFARSNVKRLRRSLEKLELATALEAWPAFERAYEARLDERDEQEDDSPPSEG